MNSQVPLSSPALSNFIRGVERRALVVAEYQSGEVVVGERAVAMAMRAFVPVAANLPITEWPALFWKELAGNPLLGQPALDGTWPADLAHLAVLPEQDRLALLLRIGGGLDEWLAATALGMDVAGYQQALARACPRDPEGHPDALGWRQLAESVQQRVRDLSPLREEQLNRLRESLVTDSVDITEPAPADPAPVAVADDDRQERQARRRQQHSRQRRSGIAQWLWLLTGAMVLAGAVWAWMSRDAAPELPAAEDDSSGLPVENPVETEILQELPLPPPADPLPPAPLPEEAQAGLARQADFLAWVAAGAPLPVDESGQSPRAAASIGPAVSDIRDL